MSLDLTVLKTILTSKKHALDFAADCDPKLFSNDMWNFANLTVGYIKTYKELPTLRILTENLAKGKNNNLIEHVKKTWAQIDAVDSNPNEFRHDLDKLKKRFAENQLLSLKDSLSKLDPGNIDISKSIIEMQKAVQSIKNLDSKKAFENKSIKEYLPAFVDKFNAKKNNPEADLGLLTNYSMIDFATNGLKQADFLIIAGESGFGKSLFLNNIAVQVWLQKNDIFKNIFNHTGKNIIYFSLEMPYEDCFNRLISRLSDVESRKIENASLTKEEFARVKKCLDFIRDYPYDFKIVDITDVCANDLENIIIESGQDFDAIFIDYLGIMQPNEKMEDQDWLKQGKIAEQIRGIARKQKRPIFSAVQLNRKSETKSSSESIGLSRLARSGTIATHATHIIQIENRAKEEELSDFVYHFIKNRKGPKPKGTLMKRLKAASLIDDLDKAIVDDKKSDNYDTFFKDHDDLSSRAEDLE